MHNTDANKLNPVLVQKLYKIQCLDMPAGDAQQAACMMDNMFYLDKQKQCHRSYCAFTKAMCSVNASFMKANLKWCGNNATHLWP
jgi:hypothetical protein